MLSDTLKTALKGAYEISFVSWWDGWCRKFRAGGFGSEFTDRIVWVIGTCLDILITEEGRDERDALKFSSFYKIESDHTDF